MNKPTTPMNLTDPNFVWTPALNTDVTTTWKKYGWVPPQRPKLHKELANLLDTKDSSNGT